MGRLLSIAAAAPLVLAGCGRSRVLEAPALELRTSHQLGGPLGVATAAEAPALGALAVTVEGVAVERLPEDWGEPVASSASLITGPRSTPRAAMASIAEVLRLLPEGFDLAGSEAAEVVGSTVPMRSETVLVPAGTSVGIDLGPPGDDAEPLVRFIIAAPGEGLPQLAISALGEDPDADAGIQGERRTMLIPWPLAESTGRFGFALPAAPHRGLGRPTVWTFTIDAVPQDAEAAAEAAAIAAALRESGTSAPSGSAHEALAATLRGATDPARLRSTLALVALSVGAHVAGEAAVLFVDDSIPVLAQAVASALEQASPDAAPGSLGWSVDRAAILAAATLHSAGRLGPAAAAMLSARFGEVGRDPGGLAALAKASSGAADFHNRLVAEHLVLLGDVSPAARVRAYDWLAAAGSAPPGYDPLGPARERRQAVDRFLQPASSADESIPVEPAAPLVPADQPSGSKP